MEREGNEEDAEDIEFDGGFRIPADIYSRLFDYQKTGEHIQDTYIYTQELLP